MEVNFRMCKIKEILRIAFKTMLKDFLCDRSLLNLGWTRIYLQQMHLHIGIYAVIMFFSAMAQTKRMAKRQSRKRKLLSKKDAKEEDAICLYCDMSYLTTGGTWIKCQVCHKWAHMECSSSDGQTFICELCI